MGEVERERVCVCGRVGGGNEVFKRDTSSGGVERLLLVLCVRALAGKCWIGVRRDCDCGVDFADGCFFGDASWRRSYVFSSIIVVKPSLSLLCIFGGLSAVALLLPLLSFKGLICGAGPGDIEDAVWMV